MSRADILKIIAVTVTFLLFIPLFQSLLFQNMADGKISINREIKVPFLPYSEKKLSLLFFGYYGCSDVCTPFLEKLSTIYESDVFKSYKKDVDIYFVNLNPAVKKHNPDEFAKYFNQNFQGIYLTHNEIMSIDREFGLYHTSSLRDKSKINHTDNLYLLEKSNGKFKLKHIYFSKLLKADMLSKDIAAEN